MTMASRSMANGASGTSPSGAFCGSSWPHFGIHPNIANRRMKDEQVGGILAAAEAESIGIKEGHWSEAATPAAG